MGKRTRKTRWRTLPIGDEQSDSEESNSTLDTRIPPTYHQKYYGRYTYSSQSTPTRRYQSDSTKSTRSSSTASENKITFNEDEYTRITTPRQDVLFKKGYLNKPKTYSTQTSTGNSTTSTGNSTGNGTPDYQSTDLEYESQFVFPNAFMDQNGIYYVNSFDPYPLMVYNAPPYYNNETCPKSKKFSTESLAETVSTTNDEASHDVVNHNGDGSVDEIQNRQPPQPNGHPQNPLHMPPPTEYGQVYNVVYPGFYYNGLCPPQDLINDQGHQSEPKRVKRRRRRKLSSTLNDGQQQNGTTSEYTEDEVSSAGEEEDEGTNNIPSVVNSPSEIADSICTTTPPSIEQTNTNSTTEPKPVVPELGEQTTQSATLPSDSVQVDNVGCDNNVHENPALETESETNVPSVSTNTAENSLVLSENSASEKKLKYDLKPDAQEFVPRAMRPEYLQYFKIPPNFVPVPLMNPMGAQTYNPQYLPPGIPVNFVQPNHHVYPGFVPGFVPPNYNMEQILPPPNEVHNEALPNSHQADAVMHDARTKSDIDINTVVSKLEEVANEPKKPENNLDRRSKNTNYASPNKKPNTNRFNSDEPKKFFPKNNKQNGYYQKKNYNKYQSTNHNSESLLGAADVSYDKTKHPVTGSTDDKITTKATVPTKPAVNEPTPSESVVSPKEMSSSFDGDKSSVSSFKEVFVEPKEIPRVSSNTSTPSSQINGKQEDPSICRDITNNTDNKERWTKKGDQTIYKKDQVLQYSDERIQLKVVENQNQKFNRKLAPNSPVKRQPTDQSSRQFNGYTKKYSETVKRSPQSPVLVDVPKKVFKAPAVIPEESNTQIKKPQWISVSNKKRRRNRNLEENEDIPEAIEETKPAENKEFEHNDFLQKLVVNAHSKEIESDKLEQAPEVITKSPVKILEVRDLEKELLNNVGIEVQEEKELILTEEKEVTAIPAQNKNKSTSKKKPKKNISKPITKRVMVTDIVPYEEEKTEETVDNKREESPIEEVKEDTPSIQETPETEVIPPIVEQENLEKKSKKKKKKQNKTLEVPPTSTTTNYEDTYDFLLENTFSNNSNDRTNMEVSQELDLIIQRGMYNSLEEKIKSLNIIPIKEEFFQSVVRSSRESSMEKTPEFSKLLANSMPKFKYCMASVEDPSSKIPLTDLNQPSTSKNGLFVENSEVNELLKDIYGKDGALEPKIEEFIKAISPPKECVVQIKKEKSIEKQIRINDPVELPDELGREKLYPITEAVKNWMTKTRENTPEVEILKSPSVIFKELREKSLDDDNCKSIPESDEEITVYSATRNNSGDSVDLLDCWENEITEDSESKSCNDVGCDSNPKGTLEGEEEEDALEVYESKYGQNEDFLELQKEIAEKKRQETDAHYRNFPKHGALPYRAICCSIM